jgi:hypothetical protein
MDLLDGLDLDFLNVNKMLDGMGSNGQFNFDPESDFFFDHSSFGVISDVLPETENVKETSKPGRKAKNKPNVESFGSSDIDLSMYSAKAESLGLVHFLFLNFNFYAKRK